MILSGKTKLKKLINNFLFETKTDVVKASYIWNMAAGMSSALESLLFSVVVTYLCGLTEAGIVNIAYAIGNLMATVGKYGVRTFQVTDVKKKYDFSAYFHARIITLFVMILTNIVYVFSKQYAPYKCVIVLLICLRFLLEAFEDVFCGACQKNGRLDVASKIFVVRGIVYFMVTLLFLLLTQNIIITLIVSVSVTYFIDGISLLTVKEQMQFRISKPDWTGVWEIIKKCTPLFASAFFFFYITNAPKYAIDEVMSDDVQACYGFIAFPVFAIELLNNFIYQPQLVDLANEWNSRSFSKVLRRMGRQMLIILGLTMTIILGGYLVGIPILSLIFSTDLSAYKNEFLVLLLGGGLLAAIGYLTTILVTMRRSMLMIYGYACIFVMSLVGYKPVIVKYGVMGGVILYACLCLLYVLYELICIGCIIGREKKCRS